MDKSAKRTPVQIKFSRYEKVVIGILGFLQFTVILDFMIISPLGAIVMPSLRISPQQFGLAVSSYAFSAGVSGFLAAGFADRFDRRYHAFAFFVGAHAPIPRRVRLAADVDERPARRRDRARPLHHIVETRGPIVERVGRDVDDPHHGRAREPFLDGDHAGKPR